MNTNFSSSQVVIIIVINNNLHFADEKDVHNILSANEIKIMKYYYCNDYPFN